MDNKYYIGKTNNPLYRINDHLNDKGSKWTNIYKPIQIIELIPNCDDYDEDKYVRIYMDKYGIDNVRGGSFSQITLTQDTITQLISMSRGTNDKCFKCGEKNHFFTDCGKKYKVFKKKKYTNKHVTCYRCGRSGHYATKCKNKTHKDGHKL